MLPVGLAPGLPHTDQQQTLIAAVGERVDRFGQHRGRAREHRGYSLGGENAEIGGQRIEDSPHRAVC
jgi:hypothetical protein